VSGSFGSGFVNVDGSSDPERLRAFLAAVEAVPSVACAKRNSLDLLDVGAGDSVLDVGCGTGEDVATLAGVVGPEGRVAGVDKSEVLIAQARRAAGGHEHNVTFAAADATALPFGDGEFDACRSDRTIQHIQDADVAVAEMARVTRPGGIVVISEMLTALDLDGDPDETTRIVLGRLWSGSERRGWISGFLPLLLTRAGLGDVTIHREAAEVSSFDEAALLLNLEELCAGAVNEGQLDENTARAWLAGMRERFGAGRATLRSEFLHVKASKHTDAG
jgi:ubiquinone/menaquinone biosynthesis C-methylase UbiE